MLTLVVLAVAHSKICLTRPKACIGGWQGARPETLGTAHEGPLLGFMTTLSKVVHRRVQWISDSVIFPLQSSFAVSPPTDRFTALWAITEHLAAPRAATSRRRRTSAPVGESTPQQRQFPAFRSPPRPRPANAERSGMLAAADLSSGFCHQPQC